MYDVRPSSGTSVPMLRSRPSQMWRWVSTKPGITMVPEASITSASVTLTPGPICRMRSRSTSTSPMVKSGGPPSMVSSEPPVMSFRSVGTTVKSTPSG
jgi:hypothetical protein